jgi:ATP-dependent 26S proteasome regulatory subunit
MEHFFQRIFFIILGAYLTYYFSLQLLEQANLGDIDMTTCNEHKLRIENYTKKQYIFNNHEMNILQDTYLPSEIRVNFSQIYGLKDEKNTINTSLFGKPNKIFKGCSNTKGVLLHGPPGTGKTMLAQAIAKDAKLILINFNIATIENKMYGESSKYITALFTLAQKLAPCVVFIDEIDCIGASRNPMDQSHVNNIKSIMLTMMDGVKTNKNDKIIIIGATNRLQSIDPALKRRIPLQIEISYPSYEDIKKYLSTMIDLDDTQLNIIASGCIGMSCSDIKQLCNTVSTLYTDEDDIVDLFDKNIENINVS